MNVYCLDDAGCLFLSPKIERPGALFNQTFAQYLLSDPCGSR